MLWLNRLMWAGALLLRCWEVEECCSRVCRHNLPRQVAGPKGSAVTSDINWNLHEEWRRYKRTSERQRKAETVEGDGWNANATNHDRTQFKTHVPLRAPHWIGNYLHLPLMPSTEHEGLMKGTHFILLIFSLWTWNAHVKEAHSSSTGKWHLGFHSPILRPHGLEGSEA